MEKQTWDSAFAASAYEEFCTRHPRYTKANRALIANAALEAGLRVLDVGSGTGRTAQLALAQLGDDGRIVCIEPAAAMREIGKSRLSEDRVSWSDNLPDSADLFDRIICGAAIWQMLPLENTLSTFAARLSPGGAMCFNIPAAYVGEADEPGGGADPRLLQLPAVLAQLDLKHSPHPDQDRRSLPTADVIAQMLTALDLTIEPWRLRTRFTQAAYRDWLKLPMISEALLGRVPATDRAAVIDAAYRQVDSHSWRWETWLGWTAWRA